MAQYSEYILSGYGSDISVHFPTPIKIDTERYEAKIGLKSFVTYNNIANVIENVNNSIKIRTPDFDDYIFCVLSMIRAVIFSKSNVGKITYWMFSIIIRTAIFSR